MLYAPTVHRYAKFNPVDDAHAIKKAFKGSGCDKAVLVNLLTKRCIKQRVEVGNAYRKLYNRELIDDMKKELSGDLETLLVAMTCSYFEYQARELVAAFKGAGGSRRTVLEVLLTRFNAEIPLLKQFYKRVCEGDLCADVRGELASDERCERLMASVLEARRDERQHQCVDMERAQQQAASLYDTDGEKLIEDEAVICELFAFEGMAQINQVAQQYETIAKKTLAEAIKSQMSGAYRDALLIILALAHDRLEFYADSLHTSVDGLGTDEHNLVRVIITRSEMDLAAIKLKFHEKHGKTLEHAIEKDTSGTFRQALLALVRG